MNGSLNKGDILIVIAIPAAAQGKGQSEDQCR